MKTPVQIEVYAFTKQELLIHDKDIAIKFALHLEDTHTNLDELGDRLASEVFDIWYNNLITKTL